MVHLEMCLWSSGECKANIFGSYRLLREMFGSVANNIFTTFCSTGLLCVSVSLFFFLCFVVVVFFGFFCCFRVCFFLSCLQWLEMGHLRARKLNKELDI